MGKIEDITRAALRVREERRQEAADTEQALRTQDVARQVERRLLATSIVRKAASRLVRYLLEREVPGDILTRTKSVKYRLGCLWKYHVETGPELAGWLLASPAYGHLLLSDGQLATQYNSWPGVWPMKEDDVADMLKPMFKRGNTLVLTFLYQEIQAATSHPVFDDEFCRTYFDGYKLSTQNTLNDFFVAQQPRKTRQARRRGWRSK